jgi:hypothetical protein
MLAITIGGQPVPKLSDVQTTMKDVPVSAAALLARAAPAPAGAVVPGAVAAAPARLGQRQPQAPRRTAPQRAQQERAVAAPLPSPVPVAAPVAAAPTPQASTVSP